LSGTKTMSKLIFGFDRFEKNGDPLPNCEDYKFKGNKVCNCGNVFLGMFQDMDFNYIKKSKRAWINLNIETQHIDKIEYNYIYPIDVNSFAFSMGYNKWPDTFEDVSVFDSIPKRVIEDCQAGRCKILINYGYEGLTGDSKDTILFEPLLDRLHFLLEKHKIPQERFIYVDSNNTLCDFKLPTKINYFNYEYCAIDWWRFTKMWPSMMYHGNSLSSGNMKKWSNTKKKLRSKYYLSFNRLPKRHRVDLVLSLDRNNLLDKGYISFANNIEDWDWRDMVSVPEKESLEKKLPLVIDLEDLSDSKHSYDKFNVRYYLDSYFQIVTGNNFSWHEDQLIFSEKIWKSITNLQPFIYLDDVGALKKLREYGFKTFEPFIDESYDGIVNSDIRFGAIEQEINKLCNKSIEEIHEWYWSIEDILKYNYYHFYENFIPLVKHNLIEECLDNAPPNNECADGTQMRERYLLLNSSDGIVQNKKDFWPFEIVCSTEELYENEASLIEERVSDRIGWEKLKNAKSVLFINRKECWFDWESYDKLNELIGKYNLDPKKFYLGNHDLNFKENFESWVSSNDYVRLSEHDIYPPKHKNLILLDNVFGFDNMYFLQYDSFLSHKNKIRDIIYNSNPKKLFMSLNGMKRPHRKMLVDFLRENNLFDSGYVSVAWEGLYLDGDSLFIEDSGQPQLHPGFDIKTDNLNSFFDESFFTIVVDTSTSIDNDWYKPLAFNWDKYRCLFYGHPFILMSNKGTLKYLKSLGYETFPEIFDESYDEIDDWKERVEFVCSEVKRVCNLDKNELRNIFEKVHDKVIYNRRNFLNYPKHFKREKNKIERIFND